MQFAKTTNYAMSLVYYLAAEGQICNTVQLSTSLGIPPSYVPKVIRLLKQAGLIDAVKGSHGGYRLAKPPESITMLEILSCTEKSMKADLFLTSEPGSASSDMPDYLRRAYEQAQWEIEDRFGGTTIAALMDSQGCKIRTHLMNIMVDVQADTYFTQYIHDDGISQILPSSGRYSQLIVEYTTGFIHPDDRKGVEAFMKKGAEVRSQDESYTKERIYYRFKTSNGYLWMEMILFRGWVSGAQTLMLTINNAATVQFELNALDEAVIQKRQELQHSYWDLIAMFQFVLDNISPEGKGHSRGVVHRTGKLLWAMRELYPDAALPVEEICAISRLAALHDIGKLTIPRDILAKPGALTPEERKLMQAHTTQGAELAQKIPTLTDNPEWSVFVYNICRFHHERYDGRGYPDGLAGEEIPLCAQVVGIVDCYDALTNDRVYNSRYSHEEAVNMIMRDECGVFSPRIKYSFLAATQKIDWHMVVDNH
ncbi:Rrf2 family transcriptional regulator [Anaerotruncus sp. AF02-27]|uniref:Rrf2 family transcriptional regulator n=1 Tax=Anaerotruncus TaxID=244127 RepID=UPI000E4BDC1E|nr:MULTISPECIES: Rrf2 family transcriptional regulator [Anaerotruncus]RGX55799.1 Rrf2 family transcriptional regulator [Anaerotruncus sp. AF02-27]